jgi:hypothetical protein
VAYVEYLEILAGSSKPPDGNLQSEIIAQLKEYYKNPGWSPEITTRRRYQNAEGGFSAPWLALLRERRDGGKGKDFLELAQVFMLGKLLWCIFEGQPLVRCGIDHEVLRDADPDYTSAISGKAKAFPEFKNTPDELRTMIRACTAGAPEWEVGPARRRLPGVVLRGGKLYPADTGDVTADNTIMSARRYWCHEVEQAREFMGEVLRQNRGGLEEGAGLLHQVTLRPMFFEVLADLERIQLVCS